MNSLHVLFFFVAIFSEQIFSSLGQLSGYQSGGGGGGGGDGEDGGLEVNIPGIPGQDYPIYAQVPDTGFGCDGRVEGGYYADTSAECQVFHICANNGEGGLRTYSILCPNGTIFNQENFICDWWFNFDCSQAEGLYSLNDANAAEAAAATGSSGGSQASYTSGR
ncbi:uncharacterized protein LOC111704720 [Eurytemora carolleeae]|uniref:uncharacterized protein LOC111704720 n=1 Tax=Eurytemora carolleeae TaxID=1294199 RepID=UPI000C75FEE9|nr:uncharacterized protein LOC111704720 [Eurytemora carolleeae]|eukprot:XP_023332811.1 uncharacterized protein LOC111704720 [Eurytemora affinis]